MGQHAPSTNRPSSDWLPDDAWRPITDPDFRDQRRELEQCIGRDLTAVTDRLAPRPYADAILWTTGLFAYRDPHATLDDARSVDLPGPTARATPAYRKAIESVGPTRATDPQLLVAVSPSIHTVVALPTTWTRCLEHLAHLSMWAIAADGSWLFVSDPADSAVSGRPRPGVVHSITHVESYRANAQAIVPFERLVIRHGHGQCWESMRIGYGGDSQTNHAFAGALSWLTAVPIERHKLDPNDPTQYG